VPASGGGVVGAGGPAGAIGGGPSDAPEAPGLDRLIRGVSLIAADDHQLLTFTRPLFDGLYELLQRSHLHEARTNEL